MDHDLLRAAERAEITEAMYRYARATDWNEPAQHRTVFVDDCVFVPPYEEPVLGIDSVIEWMHRILPRFEHTHHLLGNISITFEGDDTASAVSYVQAWHRWVKDRPDMTLWGEYHDRWRRADGEWRIAERRVLVAGMEPPWTDDVHWNPR